MPEHQACRAVAGTVDVQYLAVLADGVGAAEIDVRRRGLRLYAGGLPVPVDLTAFLERVIYAEGVYRLTAAYSDAAILYRTGQIACGLLRGSKVLHAETPQLHIPYCFFNIHLHTSSTSCGLIIQFVTGYVKE